MPSVVARDLGPIGTGSNMFRSGVAHSSGVVFIGTYGPPPGIIWKYDPKTGELTKVATPGEYQIDCMVEAPNRKIYIGTAYSGIVYELDPDTLQVRNLGAPPVESTPWIFTMTRTRGGEIYGARGVGLFHLDWRTGKMEGFGVVPGKHETLGVSSGPISRNLQERPDGLIWGDTNRWLFTFDPKRKKITPIVDVAAYDEACYGLFHFSGHSPFNDLYFAIYPRFNNRTPRHTFMVCRADTGKIEPLELPLKGICIPMGWWRGEDGKGEPRWLVTAYDTAAQRQSVAVVDVLKRRVEERWEVEGNDTHATRTWDAEGRSRWFYTGTRGGVFRAEPHERKLKRVAVNPMPVEVRCLAAAPDGRLGADSYDCGFVFTFDPATRESHDHGRVYYDDHRANYGPAAFVGEGGRYFLANHGEDVAVAKLWVTDTHTNAHRQVGESVLQLVPLSGGQTVVGTLGPSIPVVSFADPMAEHLVRGTPVDQVTCWIPAWAAKGGAAFRYDAGAERVTMLPEWGDVGPIAPLGNSPEHVAVGVGAALRVLRFGGGQPVGEYPMPAKVLALAADPSRLLLYALLEGGRVVRLATSGTELKQDAEFPFVPAERGFFVLPQSGRLVGVEMSGDVSVLDRGSTHATKVSGATMLYAGPAVHPTRDAWYYADKSVNEYTIE